MPCRHVNTLIQRVRQDSNFTSIVSPLSTTVGVQDNYIVDLFNDAKDHFAAKATEVNDTIFQRNATLTLGDADNTYNLVSSLSHDIRVVDVKYRYNDTSCWIDVPKGSIDLASDPQSVLAPISWYLQNGAIFLEGSATQGQIKLVWEERPDYLAIPIGTVSAFTSSTTELTATTISYYTGFGDDDLNNAGDLFFCVVNKYGQIVMRNVEFSSVTSGVVSFGTSFAFQSGETIAVGNRILVGRDVTTHSPLAQEAERYFIYYATEQIAGTKGASFERQTFLRRRKEEALDTLITAYSVGDKDPTEFQEVDGELMLREGW